MKICTLVLLFPILSFAQVETNFSSGGAVRIGDSTTTCDASIEGAIRFDADGADTIDYCNGTTWLTLLTSSIGGDFKADGSVAMTGELELLSENSATDPDLTFNGDENTGLFQPAADEIAFSNAGTESLRIDASGNFGIGTNNPNADLHVYGTNGIIFEKHINDDYPIFMEFHRNRLGPVNSSTKLALLDFKGADGSSIQRSAAQIEVAVDGTPGANDMPGRMTFLTTPDNTMVPVERMRIDNQGNIGVGTTAPGELLEVNGNIQIGSQATRTTATNRGQLALGSTYTQTQASAVTVNWDNGNIQEVNTFLCNGSNTITMSNLEDGTAYSLLLTGTAAHSGNCIFSSAGFTFKTSGGNSAPTASQDVLFTFTVINTTVIYSMMDDLQ